MKTILPSPLMLTTLAVLANDVSRSFECICTIWLNHFAFYAPTLYFKKNLPRSHCSFDLSPRMKN
ncbi:unnamed protein product [Gulo gulo]|uniref:Secreted protein n=1 Tax=Gulo gulo TaxID=48420 RepID=A0A9X9MDE4_GULGU|nr:unnamed protein product [Gulo gulo]